MYIKSIGMIRTTPEEFYKLYGQAIDNKKYDLIPKAKYLFKEGNAWTAIDNSEYQFITDGFDDESNAIRWLRGNKMKVIEVLEKYNVKRDLPVEIVGKNWSGKAEDLYNDENAHLRNLVVFNFNITKEGIKIYIV